MEMNDDDGDKDDDNGDDGSIWWFYAQEYLKLHTVQLATAKWTSINFSL